MMVFADQIFEFLICINFQRLDAGDDPVAAFVLSSEAAMAGAELTKNMQARVISNLCLLI
jgi:hypothetical protein